MGGASGSRIASFGYSTGAALLAATGCQASALSGKPHVVQSGADLSALAEIHRSAFDDSWSRQGLQDLLAVPGTFAVAQDEGFILVRAVADEAEVLTLAVRPNARRRGTGRALVQAAASHAHALGAARIFLEVAEGNVAACQLYAELGFTAAGRRAGYYAAKAGGRQDALILRSNLPLTPLGK